MKRLTWHKYSTWSFQSCAKRTIKWRNNL